MVMSVVIWIKEAHLIGNNKDIYKKQNTYANYGFCFLHRASYFNFQNLLQVVFRIKLTLPILSKKMKRLRAPSVMKSIINQSFVMQHSPTVTVGDAANKLPASTSFESFSQNSEDSNATMFRGHFNLIIKPHETSPVTSEIFSVHDSDPEPGSSPVEFVRNCEVNEISRKQTEGVSGPNSRRTESLSPFLVASSQEEEHSWLPERRNAGLYVWCDACDKERFLWGVKDPLQLPKKWYCCHCEVNRDTQRNKCSTSQQEIPKTTRNDPISHQYNAGNIVFAKIPGYPWWPALVEKDPDSSSLHRLVGSSTEYHVTFFDSARISRAWVPSDSLIGFDTNKMRLLCNMHKEQRKTKRLFAKRFAVAVRQAEEASALEVPVRLRQFGFMLRFQSKDYGKKN